MGNNEKAQQVSPEDALPAPGRLGDRIQGFVDELMHEFRDRAKRSPRKFKARVLAQIKACMPPYAKRAGAPQKKEISKAWQLMKAQEQEFREGRRRAVNWPAIARECSPQYARARSSHSRNRILRRLQNSTRARERRLRSRLRPKHTPDDTGNGDLPPRSL